MDSEVKKGMFILMSLLLAVVIGLIGFSLGATLVDKVEGSSLSAWVAAVATVVIAILTMWLAYETQVMRRGQQEQITMIQRAEIRPDVDLSLEFSPAAFNFADLVLRNNGPGMAKNVRILFSHVEGRGSLEDSNRVLEDLLKPSFVSKGVSTLGPRREISSYVVSFLDLADDANLPIMDVCFEAKISCEDSSGKTYDTVSIIDISEFRGISELGGRPAYDTVTQLKRIGDLIEKSTKK